MSYGSGRSDGQIRFLDASIIVRYLTQDEPVHAERARQIIEEVDELSITDGTITEAAYVLTRTYGVPRANVVDALVELLQRTNISVYRLDTGLVIAALYLCRPSGRVSFADAMLWAVARSGGPATLVYTFDRRFPSTGIRIQT